MRLPALLFSLAAASACAETLNPTLQIEPAGGNLRLHLAGTADLPRDLLRDPLIHVEFLFVPLRVERRAQRIPGGFDLPVVGLTEGTPVSLGFRRARAIPDAVDPEGGKVPPSLIETEPFTVTGQFAGVYRARVTFDPARQTVQLRARNLPVARAEAQIPWGNPADFPLQRRRAKLELEEDCATARRLAADLESLWTLYRRAPKGDAGWTESLDAWRARLALLEPRNARRPAHAIVETMPALRSSLAGVLETLSAQSDQFAARMAVPPAERPTPDPARESLSRRATLALRDLESALGTPAPSADEALSALLALRHAPLALRAWHSAWLGKKPGFGSLDWESWANRQEADLVDALFIAGRAAPATAYMELALAGRALLADSPPGSGRSRSLFATYASRILEETTTPLDSVWIDSCEREIAERLARVERAVQEERPPR
ncbi:MAG: hypothetical protein HYY18_00710 [Planctomycetes bacterium]|nr:hypothetical protein [Planctomycetota bacterium]